MAISYERWRVVGRDRQVSLQPLTHRDRAVAGAFILVFASGLWLGALRLIPVRDAAAIVGLALSVHGVALVLNLGRVRDSGLTMDELSYRFRQLCYRRVPILRPLLFVDMWFGAWLLAPSRIWWTRIISSLVTVLFGLLLLILALAR